MREGLRKEGGSVDNLALKNIRVLFFLKKTLKVCPDACQKSLCCCVHKTCKCALILHVGGKRSDIEMLPYFKMMRSISTEG